MIISIRRSKWPLESAYHSRCRLNRLLIMGIWSEYHFGIWDKSCDFGLNRFRKSGKCCPLWTTLQLFAMVVTPWHNGYCISDNKYITFHHRPVGWWFSAGNWQYYRFWTNLSISKRPRFNLFAHKWSKENKEKFPSHNFWYPKVHSMHIWNLISERFKMFASKLTAVDLNQSLIKRRAFHTSV